MGDPRLDPACSEGRKLVKMHGDQAALLSSGDGGQLTLVVAQTQKRQLDDHVHRCARCSRYDPRCATCGFDPRRERHGWMCQAQPRGRWRDVFPWNWRSRRAPAAAADPAKKDGRAGGAPVRTRPHVTPDGVTSAPGPSPAAPAAPAAPGVRPSAAVPSRAVAARNAAYRALGLVPGASSDAVRAAYRAKAHQYHPDKVAHMGPEFREVAEKKMAEVNAAYERIKRAA